MDTIGELRRENAALRERIALLNAAVLRINASLDLDTVLQQVVNDARALTGAAYGLITTVDDVGEAQDFVASGFTGEDRRRVGSWPHGQAFFEHLRDLPGVLRLDDLPGSTRSLGYDPELTLSKTMQAMPRHHGGHHVGNFFLGEKAAGGRSPTRTRRCWCCSRRRRPRRSPTPARTATSGAPAATSRPSWTPRRSAWW